MAVGFCVLNGRKRYTDREILDAVRAAGAILGRPPGIGTYGKLRRFNPAWPACVTVAHRFGSWRNALVAAGFGKSGPHGPMISDASIFSALREAAAAGVFSCAAYNRFARERGLPCLATVCKRFGSWEKAWLAAGLSAPTEMAERARREEIREKTARARAVAEDILRQRPFFVPGDAKTLGFSMAELKFLAKEIKAPVVRFNMAEQLASLAKMGFPENGDPRGQGFAIALAQGESMAEIARKNRLTREGVRRIVTRYCAQRGKPCRGGKWELTDGFFQKDLPEFLRELAGRLGRTPTKADYETAKPPGWPTLSAMRLHGGWRGFLASAGLVPRWNPVTPERLQRTLNAIRTLAADLGMPPLMRQYEALRQRNSDLLHPLVLSKRFGSWRKLAMECYLETCGICRRAIEENAATCVFCGELGAEPLPLRGKVVCRECFTELYRLSAKRQAELTEQLALERQESRLRPGA